MLNTIPDEIVAAWVHALRQRSGAFSQLDPARSEHRIGSARKVGVDDDFARRARHLVEARLDDPSFGVSDLARGLRMSPRHLRRRLREEVGDSPSAFIRSIRLERARSLIEDGCHSVGEVAQAVRINSLSYFARCFREEFGLNPSEYGLETGLPT